MRVIIDVTKLYLEIDCFIKLSKLKKSLDYGTKYDRVIFILINATGQRLIYKNIFLVWCLPAEEKLLENSL